MVRGERGGPRQRTVFVPFFLKNEHTTTESAMNFVIDMLVL